MVASAFDALRSGAKQQNKRQRLQNPGSSEEKEQTFVHCPVCGSSISKVLAQEHVNSCLDARPGEDGLERHTEPAGIGQKGSAKEENDRAWGLKPGISTHQPSCVHPPALSKQSSLASRGSNALAHLMHNQRECSKVQTFLLEQQPEGSWAWQWWSSTGKSGKVRYSARETAAPAPSQHAEAQRVEVETRAAVPEVHFVWTASSQLSGAVCGDGHLQGPGIHPKRPDKQTLRLVTNVEPGQGGPVTWDAADLESNLGGNVFRGGASLLKSALQKNVRLCRAGSAVRCALHLMKEDAGELLRRLSIICLEDAVLHPSLPLVVWLMAAHAKGYQLGCVHATAILRMVAELATVPMRDCWPGAQQPTAQPEGPGARPPEGPAASGRVVLDEGQLLVRAISVRAAFGGMAGDVSMLRSFAALWQRRLQGEAGLPPGPLPDAGQLLPASQLQQSSPHGLWLPFVKQVYGSLQCKIEPVGCLGRLQRSDIPASAIDFHVSSILQSLLQHPAIAQAASSAAGAGAASTAEHALQRAMWRFRSSVNRKQRLQIASTPGQTDAEPSSIQSLHELWSIAAGPAESWSAAYIRNRFT